MLSVAHFCQVKEGLGLFSTYCLIMMNGYARKWQVFRRSDAAKVSLCNFPGNYLLFIKTTTPKKQTDKKKKTHSRNIVILSVPSDDLGDKKCQNIFFLHFFFHLNINSFKIKTSNLPFIRDQYYSNQWLLGVGNNSLIYIISHYCDFLLINVVKRVDRVKLLIPITVLCRVIRKKRNLSL